MRLSGARVLVAGLGLSGRAAAGALRRAGAEVVTFDDSGSGDLSGAEQVRVADLDLVVTSPGLPPSHPVLRAADGRVPVVSEIELAWWLRVDRPGGPAPWLGVTGTNGKTTTVGMLAAILTAGGEHVAQVGNVGTPAVDMVADPAVDVLVVELSSFQLHFTSSVELEAAAVLNVAPDHLDWHGSIEAYAQDKARIFDGARAACVYGTVDPWAERLVEVADAPGALRVGVTVGAPGVGQMGVVDGALVDRAFGGAEGRQVAHVTDLAHLAGPDGRVAEHVVADALAAAALALAHGVAPGAVADGLRGFRPGSHRISTVATVGDVVFVDDSKATNAHAASASLAGFDAGTVVWVAGGLAKGATFDELVAARADRLRGVVLIGTDRQPWLSALARHAPQVPVVEVDASDTGTVMTRAVAHAHRLALDPSLGDPSAVVLLAPAAASMDQFVSYADRGDQFAAAAQALAAS